MSSKARFLPLLMAGLAAAGCTGSRSGPRVVSAAPAPPKVTPRRGAHPQRSTPPAGALERLAWQAERRGIAKWVGVYAQEAVPGARPAVNYRAEEDFPAASVIKLPVMLAVFDVWNAHPARRRNTQVQWVRRMMQASDNPATNRLIDWLGKPTGDRWRNTPGMKSVNGIVQRVTGNRTTVTRLQSKLNPPRPGPAPTNRGCPWELAQLVVHLSARETRRDPAAAEMLRIMRGSAANHRTRIPAAIPKTYRARVANKTGSLSRVVNDLALVETPSGRRYVLCIMLDGISSHSRADRFCREITAACWKRWAK